MLLSFGLYSICFGLTPAPTYTSLTELEHPSITAIKPHPDCRLSVDNRQRIDHRSRLSHCNAVGGAFKFMMSFTVFVELSITVTEFEPVLYYVDLVIRGLTSIAKGMVTISYYTLNVICLTVYHDYITLYRFTKISISPNA